MAQERKRLLIVDDTEIDRIILKSILCREFDIIEANSGNLAFEYITERKDLLDAILLDISMPHIDGFDVLQFMKDKKISIPVFLVTAEPTRDNVERALQFRIEEFIGKPFDKDDVLRRLRSRLGVLPNYDIEKGQLTEMLKYISDLEILYRNYLAAYNKDDTHYRIMADLMSILVTQYSRSSRGTRMDPDNIKLISRAAYFCDIGEMFIPDKRLMLMDGQGQDEVQAMYQRHTEFGASFIRLNRAETCRYFVEVCSDMCLHHHERWDGHGYPNRIEGKNNSVFNQLCGLVDEFDKLRSKFYGDRAKPVSFVFRRLMNDEGLASPEVFALLEDCERPIMDYFMRGEF